jgi:hypothetical protein
LEDGKTEEESGDANHAFLCAGAGHRINEGAQDLGVKQLQSYAAQQQNSQQYHAQALRGEVPG